MPSSIPARRERGDELQVFHLANAFLQEASVNAADCDVHFELSQASDKNASQGHRGNARG